MSIWSSRFGEEGVNLLQDNAFRLQIANASTSPFTLNLFNLGGSASTQTSITTSFVSALNPSVGAGVDLQGSIVNGVVVATLDISFYFADLTFLGPYNFVIGTTIAQINAFFANNVVNQQGQVGSFVIQEVAGNPNFYTSFITVPNFNFTLYSTSSPPFVFLNQFYQNEQRSFVTNNPLVTFRGPKNSNISFIQNSEIGNAYKVMGMDVYSDRSSQVLEPLNYFYRDSNGDVQGAVTSPTIDPFQPNRASLQMIYVDEFQIFTNTQFQYTIDALTEVYLTFNYVNFGVEDFKMFDKVFYQQVRDKFWMDKKLIQQSRVKSIHIE
jgi:hypothetical protein